MQHLKTKLFEQLKLKSCVQFESRAKILSKIK
jgi:hypothetical protein